MSSRLSRKILLCVLLSIAVVAILLALHQPGIPVSWAAGFVVFVLFSSIILVYIEGEQQQAVQRGQPRKNAAEFRQGFVALLQRVVYGVVIVTGWIAILVFGMGLRFAPLSSEPLRVGLGELRKPWDRQKWVTLEGVAALDMARIIGSEQDLNDEWVERYYFCPLLPAGHPALEAIEALRADSTLSEKEKEERLDAILERALEDTPVVLRHEFQRVEDGSVDLIAGRGSSVTGILYDGPDNFVREVYSEMSSRFSSEKVLMLYGGHEPEPLPVTLLVMTLAATAMSACIWHWKRIGLVPRGKDESERKLGRQIVTVCVVLMVLSGLVVAKGVIWGYYLW